jgi:hypothetical protein
MEPDIMFSGNGDQLVGGHGSAWCHCPRALKGTHERVSLLGLHHLHALGPAVDVAAAKQPIKRQIGVDGSLEQLPPGGLRAIETTAREEEGRTDLSFPENRESAVNVLRVLIVEGDRDRKALPDTPPCDGRRKRPGGDRAKEETEPAHLPPEG